MNIFNMGVLKKTFVISLVFVLLLSFSACKEENLDQEDSSTTQTEVVDSGNKDQGEGLENQERPPSGFDGSTTDRCFGATVQNITNSPWHIYAHHDNLTVDYNTKENLNLPMMNARVVQPMMTSNDLSVWGMDVGSLEYEGRLVIDGDTYTLTAYFIGIPVGAPTSADGTWFLPPFNVQELTITGPMYGENVVVLWDGKKFYQAEDFVRND